VKELSLHIMDIAENAVAADATLIEIGVTEDKRGNRMCIRIRDNGKGIPGELIESVADPFYTTRTTRRVGLGLSLFREATRRCGGSFEIRSKKGEGTEVLGSFRRDDIDRAPLGDLLSSLVSLIIGNPGVDFIYHHDVDGQTFHLDTREVKQTLDGLPIHEPEVIKFLKEFLLDSLTKIEAEGYDSTPSGRSNPRHAEA